MLVSTVTRSPPLIEDNTADKREKKKRKAVRGRQENRSEGSRIKQDTAPGGEQEQEGTWGEKAKNIKGADAATRQVCELQGERGGQTPPP